MRISPCDFRLSAAKGRQKDGRVARKDKSARVGSETELWPKDGYVASQNGAMRAIADWWLCATKGSILSLGSGILSQKGEEEMSEWKYLVKDVGASTSVDALRKLLDDWGVQGWELVSIMTLAAASKLVAIFKKPSGAPTQN